MLKIKRYSKDAVENGTDNSASLKLYINFHSIQFFDIRLDGLGGFGCSVGEICWSLDVMRWLNFELVVPSVNNIKPKPFKFPKKSFNDFVSVVPCHFVPLSLIGC